MRIWIVGANGQLARQMGDIIASQKCELGQIHTSYATAEVVKTSKAEVDISNLNVVKNFFRAGNFDLVFNCAAMTNADEAEKNPDKAMKTNAVGVRNLALAIRNTDCKLVHISSDYVFNGKSQVPYNESDTCDPINIYGKSKLLGEQYVREILNNYFIVRTSWLYGYSGGNFLRTIISKAKKLEPLRVVDDQIGTPTYVGDLVYHLLRIALTEEYGVYHCAGRGMCSWYEFACEIVKLTGLKASVSPCTTNEYPRIARRPKFSALDNMMLRCTIGDEMRSWRIALAQYINDYEGR